MRLSEASAKARLDERVTRKDAKKAIELLDYCLMQVGFDKETGKIDIDRLGSKITAKQRSSISVIKEIIGAVEEHHNNKIVPIEKVIEAAKEKNLTEDQVNDVLEKLRRSGDIFEPKRGFIQRL